MFGYFPRRWLDAPRDIHGSAARGRRPRVRLHPDDLPPRPRSVRLPCREQRASARDDGTWSALEAAGEA